MKRLTMIAVLVCMAAVLFAAGDAQAQAERTEIMVLIPLQYMSGTMAAQVFGGQVIPPSPYYGMSRQQGFGGQTGYGGGYSGRSGPQIGNQGVTSRMSPGTDQRGFDRSGGYGNRNLR